MMLKHSTRYLTTCLAVLTPTLALSASILVNTKDDELNDDGDCSLREAVASANNNSVVDNCNVGNAGSDSITLLVAGTMTLGSELAVTEALSVVGPGRDALTIDAASGGRHFSIDMPDNTHDFSIQNVTLSGGSVSDTGGGSILAVQVGTLTFDTVRLNDNQAMTNLNDINGGAVAMLLRADNNSRLEILDSILENNTAAFNGGAVYISGSSANLDSLEVRRSRFSGNTASGAGGAISANGVRDVLVSQSVFERNEALFEPFQASDNELGGALHWNPGSTISPDLLIEQSTFNDNYGQESGGAVAIVGGDSIIVNATFHDNQTGSSGGQAIGLFGGSHELFFNTLSDNGRVTVFDWAIHAQDSASVALGHNILWTDWQLAPACNAVTGAAFSSLGYNLVQDSSCTAVPSDVLGADPRLGILADYGVAASGLVVKTRLPVPGSPAIDGGNISCPGPGGGSLRGGSTSVDQRGITRPQAGPSRGASPPCDIGAVEYRAGSEPIDNLFSDRFDNNP